MGPTAQMKKKKKPRKIVQPDLRLKSYHQEEQSTYESMRVRKESENNINIFFNNAQYICSSKMTLWHLFYNLHFIVAFITFYFPYYYCCQFTLPFAFVFPTEICYFSPLKALFRLDIAFLRLPFLFQPLG